MKNSKIPNDDKIKICRSATAVTGWLMPTIVWFTRHMNTYFLVDAFKFLHQLPVHDISPGDLVVGRQLFAHESGVNLVHMY